MGHEPDECISEDCRSVFAVRPDASNTKIKKDDADNRTDRRLHKEKGGPAAEDRGSLAGQESARQPFFDEKGHSDGKDAEIVKQRVGRDDQGPETESGGLQVIRDRAGPEHA